MTTSKKYDKYRSFVDVDEFINQMEVACNHDWSLKGICAVGFTPKSKKVLFNALMQCTKCKEIMLGSQNES